MLLGRRRVSFTIFLGALALRIGLFIAAGGDARPWYGEVEKIASSVVLTGEFGNPYKIPTGPTAHFAPAYPYFVAGIFALFGMGHAAGVIQALLAIAVCSLQYALLPALSSVLGLGWRVGRIAGICGAVLPLRMIIEIGGGWEVPYSAVILMALFALTIRTAGGRQSGLTLRLAVLYGSLWGFALLLTTSLVPILPAFAAFSIATAPPAGRRKTLGWWLAAMFTMSMWLTPWLYRNYTQLGHFVFIRSNFGLEFAMSNHPNSTPTWYNNYQRVPHPSTHLGDAVLITQIGELAYNRMRMGEALQWIRAHPDAFLILSAKRAFYFWFPPHRLLPVVLLAGGTTIAAFCGLYVLLRRRRRTMAWLLLLTWLSFSSVYYLIQFGARYRYPIDWSILLLASVWVHSLWHSSWLTPFRVRMRVSGNRPV
jgi:hypothetical protein